MTTFNNCKQETQEFINALSAIIREGNFYIDFSTGCLYYNNSYVGIVEDDSTTLALVTEDPYDGLKELYSVSYE